jgi:hypothetical protein
LGLGLGVGCWYHPVLERATIAGGLHNPVNHGQGQSHPRSTTLHDASWAVVDGCLHVHVSRHGQLFSPVWMMLVEGVAARRYVRLLAFMHGQPLPCLAADPKTMLDTACSYEHARGCGTTLVLMDVSTARRRQLSTSQARLRRRALLKRFSLRLVCRSAGWLRLGAELVVSSHQLLASASDTMGGWCGAWRMGRERRRGWHGMGRGSSMAGQGRADGRRQTASLDRQL